MIDRAEATNWVEVDEAALRGNLAEFRRRLGAQVRLGAVVKSNAYGHGMREVSRIALSAGADWLCVNGVDEALDLRKEHAEARVLVMGYVPLRRLRDVAEHDLQPVVANRETLEELDRLGRSTERPVHVHVKVETGTNRQGVPESEVFDFAAAIAASPGLRLAGVGTHFANIEDTTDHTFAEEQIATFARVCESLAAAGHAIPLRHAACSAAALLFTRTHLDLARIGISMYGLWPSRETYVSCLELGKPRLDLRPALTWKTRVAQVKHVAENSSIGYGCTYRTTRESKIAVLPVGYHEGYDRGLSRAAHVLVRGRRAPVRGRVCMNMTMIDVTDVPGVSLEDEVVLLGRQGGERITAEQLAEWAGTIAYEIVARIHPALPRYVV